MGAQGRLDRRTAMPERPMRIEGTISANLRAAIASVKRQRNHPVHIDTIDHWQRLLDYSRQIDRQPSGEFLGDLIAELAAEMESRRAS